MLRFTRWRPLEATDIAETPDLPAVVQLSTTELLSYPNGRSTMLWYGGGSCRAALRAGQKAVREFDGPVQWRFRPSDRAQAELKQLLQRFRRRFGALPRCQ